MIDGEKHATASASSSIVGGGIAAYKSLELVRRLKERGAPCARS